MVSRNVIQYKGLDILIKFCFILNAFRNLLLFSGMYGLASVFFYAIYGSVAVLIIAVLYMSIRTPIKLSVTALSSFVLIILLVAIPMTYGGLGWTSNGYSAISFLLTMVLIVFSNRVIIQEKTILTCYKVAVIEAIFAIALSLFSGSYEYGSLVLHMGNPNQTAIVLWSIFSFCFLYWTKKKSNHKASVALWALMLGTAFLIYLTDCRAILLSFIITIGLYFFVKRNNQVRPIPRLLQIILCLTPIFIPAMVLTLMSTLPSNITFLGKLIFSGREQIWQKIVDSFLAHPFTSHLTESPFAHYVIQNGATVLKNMGAHNGVLAIQWYYGFLTLLLVCIVMYSRIKDAKKSAEINSESCVTYIAIISTIFSLSFEEGMIMGNVATTLILPLLFIICQSEEHNNAYSE